MLKKLGAIMMAALVSCTALIASGCGAGAGGEVIEGEDGEFGIFVTTVNGITADAENEEWWRFSRNGEVLNTGIDKVAVKDGDSFAIELIVGYENY